MFEADDADRWRTTKRIVTTARHLIAELQQRHPDAYAFAATDPHAALAQIPHLTVVRDNTARNAICPIDGTYNAVTATIRYRETGNPARDHFTLLHELGHHLLAINDDWNYDVVPLLHRAKLTTHVEERLVNAFASLILIPDEQANLAFRRGVSASAALDLYLTTNASATACLARCLLEPGHRMVLLATGHGHVWYAQSNGEPYAPSADVEQPSIAHGAHRAITGDGATKFSGHEGIHYRSGKTNPNVTWDIRVHDTLVFAVVEPTLIDTRVSASPTTWTLTCLAACGETFTADDAAETCRTCGERRCPRCHGCECRNETHCSNCTIALPTASARAGKTLCDECE